MQQQDPLMRASDPQFSGECGGKTAYWIIGVGGVAMGGLAICLKRMGHRVGGSDQGIYPPMSDMLHEAGVAWEEGFARGRVRGWLQRHPDLCVVVGNAIPRGNPELEEALSLGCTLSSLPELLHARFLAGVHSVVISGTHGKTTTSNLTAWLLERLGLEPGWFIGGKPCGLAESLRPAGEADGGPPRPFVLEGDEYDTVFYDKRSKFFHYWPRTLVINHVEFDHADIFESLDPIRTAFRRLVNQVPENGLVLLNGDAPEPCAVAARSLAPLVAFGSSAACAYRMLEESSSPVGSLFRLELPGDPAWLGGLAQAGLAAGEPSLRLEQTILDLFPGHGPEPLANEELGKLGRFRLLQPDETVVVEVEAAMSGAYSGRNILAALAVVDACGGDRLRALELLKDFTGPARRMDRYECRDGLLIYDDFGHHPTAVREALEALRRRHPERWITAIVEPRSNTSVRNVMQEEWIQTLCHADAVIMGALHRPWKYAPAELYDFNETARRLAERGVPFHQEDEPARIANWLGVVMGGTWPEDVCAEPLWPEHAPREPGRHLWVIFSNGSFGGLRQLLIELFGQVRG